MKKVKTEILHTLAKFAEANDGSNVRFAAALVRNNKIVSVGFNRMKSHPFQAKYGKNELAIYLHAEVHAIKNALRDYSIEELSKMDMYITRVKKPTSCSEHYVWGLAKPCSGCQRAIAEFGVKRVIYSTDEHGCYEVL